MMGDGIDRNGTKTERMDSVTDPPPGIPSADEDAAPPASPAAPPVLPVAPPPSPGGWAAWGPGQDGRPSRDPFGHPLARAVAWIVGLALLALLALITTTGQSVGRSLSPAYRAGMFVGDLGFGLLIGAGIRYVWNRVGRGKEGARRLGALWIIPLAAIVMVIPLMSSLGQLGSQPGGSGIGVPNASAPPANSYVHIAAPFDVDSPTDAERQELLPVLQNALGKNRLSDGTMARLTRDDELVGYLIVLVGVAAISDPSGALDGVTVGLKDEGLSPRPTTVGSQAVLAFTLDDWSGVAWVDGPFVAQVFGADDESAITLAQAVLDAN
jgi:hypothetical protein